MFNDKFLGNGPMCVAYVGVPKGTKVWVMPVVVNFSRGSKSYKTYFAIDSWKLISEVRKLFYNQYTKHDLIPPLKLATFGDLDFYCKSKKLAEDQSLQSAGVKQYEDIIVVRVHVE